MRRILCLLMALCLFPLAVFAESTPQPSAASSFMNRMISAVGPISTATPAPPKDASQTSDILSFMSRSRTAQEEASAATPTPTSLPPAPKASATPTPTEDVSEKEPQPMDGMMFLHRLLFALSMLDLECVCFDNEPTYLYSPSTGDGYLRFSCLLFTLSHYDRTFKSVNVYYVDSDSNILDKACNTLPAILFALTSIDTRNEYDAFYDQSKDSFLAAYKDPAVAKQLILDARQNPLIIGGYYLTADDATYQLSPLSSGPNASSSYFTATDRQTASKPGKDLYCLFIRYTIAKYQLGILDHTPILRTSYSPEGYACYTFGRHIEFFTNRSTGLEQNPTYIHDNVFEQIPIDDLKDVYALYFALLDRPLDEEITGTPNDPILKEFDDITELRSLVEECFAPGNIVGDYRMYTHHYTHKYATTHTYFGAGVNYNN